MAGNLISDLRDHAAGYSSVKELSSAATQRLTDEVAGRYVSDTSAIWWWTVLKGDARVIAYGEDEDGLEKLREVLSAGANAFMVVTDDEPPPWVAFSGVTGELLDLISQVQFFEYFIVDPDYKRVVFDTHDNCLVVVEDPMEGMREGRSN